MDIRDLDSILHKEGFVIADIIPKKNILSRFNSFYEKYLDGAYTDFKIVPGNHVYHDLYGEGSPKWNFKGYDDLHVIYAKINQDDKRWKSQLGFIFGVMSFINPDTGEEEEEMFSESFTKKDC